MSQTSRSSLAIFDPSFDYGQLSRLIGFHLRSASLLDFRTFPETMGDRSVTPLRYSVLEVVGANPELQQVQIAAMLGLSKSAATLAIDYWQERDCMIRRRSGSDRRAHGVLLTEQGRRKLAELRPKVAHHDAMLTASLSQEEIAQLFSPLRKIINDIVRN